MTNTAASRQVVEQYYQHISSGDTERLLALHHPDICFAMAGTTIVSGRHRGLEPFLAHIGTHVLGKLDATAEPFIKDWRIALADDDHVVGLLRGSLPVLAGGRYEQTYLQIFRIANDRITGVAEFYDTVMVETGPLANRLQRPRSTPAAAFDLGLDRARTPGSGDRAVTMALAAALQDAMTTGDEAALRALHAEDFVGNIIGTTPVSGQTRGLAAGPDAERSALAARAAGGTSNTATPFRIVCADAHAVCVMYADDVALAAGGYYRQCCGVVYEVRDGRLAEMHKFPDTVEVERALFDNPLINPQGQSPSAPFDLAAPI